MNETLLHFEKTVGIGPTRTARLLGIAYVTYCQIKAGSRPLQEYHAKHIQALLLLSQQALSRLIKEHT